MNRGLNAAHVDLHPIEPQDTAQGNQVAGSSLVRPTERAEIEADTADGHGVDPGATGSE
jgi:hypothetical protein